MSLDYLVRSPGVVTPVSPVAPPPPTGEQNPPYDVDPNLEGLVPFNPDLAAYSYQRNGLGPLKQWDIAGKRWL